MNSIEDLFSGEWADLRVVSGRVADLEVSDSLHELPEEIVIDLIGNEEAFRGNARLTGVKGAGCHRVA